MRGKIPFACKLLSWKVDEYLSRHMSPVLLAELAAIIWFCLSGTVAGEIRAQKKHRTQNLTLKNTDNDMRKWLDFYFLCCVKKKQILQAQMCKRGCEDQPAKKEPMKLFFSRPLLSTVFHTVSAKFKVKEAENVAKVLSRQAAFVIKMNGACLWQKHEPAVPEPTHKSQVETNPTILAECRT